jgi:N-ethylmaleimide reductase
MTDPTTPTATPAATLFDPLTLGDIALRTRIVMAPLTRNRAAPGQVPTPLMAEYYAQRADPAAGAALIVSEASQISPQGRGWANAPGCHDAAQREGWRAVTRAVHERGGRIALQLWHVGRVSHHALQPGGAPPVSSTARASTGRAMGPDGPLPCSPPRALALHEIPGIVDDYRRAAALALEAGFDGVEVHGANGYLPDQFLRDTINDRSDAYGGPIEHRVRFLLEVVQAVAGEAGAGRTGLRLSPATRLGLQPETATPPDTQAQALFTHLVDALAPLRLAWLHVVEGQTGGARDAHPFDFDALRRRYRSGGPGAWIGNNGYTAELALQAVAEGRVDAVAFGRPFIANPDLGRRLREGLPWAAGDPATYYSSGPAGYTDYPAWVGPAPG